MNHFSKIISLFLLCAAGNLMAQKYHGVSLAFAQQDKEKCNFSSHYVFSKHKKRFRYQLETGINSSYLENDLKRSFYFQVNKPDVNTYSYAQILNKYSFAFRLQTEATAYYSVLKKEKHSWDVHLGVILPLHEFQALKNTTAIDVSTYKTYRYFQQAHNLIKAITMGISYNKKIKNKRLVTQIQYQTHFFFEYIQ